MATIPAGFIRTFGRAMGTLSEDAIKRVGGRAWEPLRETFLLLSDTLLGVSPDACGLLTTIYVKFQIDRGPSDPVYAVAWLKNSKRIVVGLALPDDVQAPALGAAPAGMTYKGLTKYFELNPGDQIPEELPTWAALAFRRARDEKG